MRLNRYPLPEWLQYYMEQNIGRPPLWTFPSLPPTADGLTFEQVGFDNAQAILDMFAGDEDPFVDARFKEEQLLYEYICHLRIVLPYSGKHGGCDWLVITPDHRYAGLLHMYDFSRETIGFSNRQCSVGYVIAAPFRGTGLAYRVMEHLHQYLFQKLDRLLLVASTRPENRRSRGFLKRLGYEDRTADYGIVEERYYELYRSPRARTLIQSERRRAEEKYQAWLAQQAEAAREAHRENPGG